MVVVHLNGTYILQIATLNKAQNFELELTLLSEFSQDDYPQNECGDSLPSNPDDYPVKFYPVNIPYSKHNLDFAWVQNFNMLLWEIPEL